MEATATRLRLAKERGELVKQATAIEIAKDRGAIEAVEAAALPGVDARQPRRARERAQAKVNLREFRLLERADEEWVLGLRARKIPIESAMSAAGSTPCDELLWYALEQLKLRAALAALAPAATYTDDAGKVIERLPLSANMYEPEMLNILGILTRSIGHGGGPEAQAALLCDERWMRLLGFNVQEVHEGATQRSVSLRGKTRDDQKRFVEADEAGPVREDGRAGAPRGVLSSQTLAGHESE